MSLCNNRIHRVNFSKDKILEIGLDDFMNASRQVFRFYGQAPAFLDASFGM